MKCSGFMNNIIKLYLVFLDTAFYIRFNRAFTTTTVCQAKSAELQNGFNTYRRME